jgi:hypothetical protein
MQCSTVVALTRQGLKRRHSTLNLTNAKSPSNDLSLNDSWAEILANVPITYSNNDIKSAASSANPTAAEATDIKCAIIQQQQQQRTLQEVSEIFLSFRCFTILLNCVFVADKQKTNRC